MKTQIVTRKGTLVQDPPLALFLFSDVRMAWVWLILRLWLGYTWLNAGLHKVSNPAWVETGEALQGFWTAAVENIAFDWYRNFIQTLLDAQAYTWFGKVIAYGECLIGLALILGLFTGIAAVLGGFLNWNFIMAGTASTNGMLFLVSVLLVLAWKVAGYIGLDYFALPYLGTPWPGKKVEELAEPGSAQSS